MLYLIGIGLHDEKDMSIKAVEAAKKCDELYLELYTSPLKTDAGKIGNLIGKKVELIDRSFLEEGIGNLVENAKTKDIGILVGGDFFAIQHHIPVLLVPGSVGQVLAIRAEAHVADPLVRFSLDPVQNDVHLLFLHRYHEGDL